jgi:hypothetical protein
MPPALVAIMPPMVAEPCAENAMGRWRPTSAAAARAAWSTQPASTSIVIPTRSTERTLLMRARESTICGRPGRGVAPPERPVLPP